MFHSGFRFSEQLYCEPKHKETVIILIKYGLSIYCMIHTRTHAYQREAWGPCRPTSAHGLIRQLKRSRRFSGHFPESGPHQQVGGHL